MEIWDLYNREGKKTGRTWERSHGGGKGIPDGYYHMVVDILVQHVDGTFLLTKRDTNKDVYPGYWEASAGGAALADEEPLDAAKRELYEETGLTALSMKLVSHTFREPSHSMFYSYLALVDADKDSVVLQEGETVEYKWVDETGFIEYTESDLAIKTHNDRYKDIIEEIKVKKKKKIEHIAMYVNNLEAARDFFVKYLGGTSNDGYHNKSTGFRSYFISFAEGARLEIMSKPSMEDSAKTINRTGYSHIAFSVGSADEVDRLTRVLREDGYELISGPRVTGDGYYESCIVGIEGNQIEITV